MRVSPVCSPHSPHSEQREGPGATCFLGGGGGAGGDRGK